MHACAMAVRDAGSCRYIKKVLGAQKVTSIAVVAPGSTPGSVGKQLQAGRQRIKAYESAARL